MNDSIAGYDIRLLYPGAYSLIIVVGHDLHDPHLEDLGGHHVPTGSFVFLPGDAPGEQSPRQSVSQEDSSQRLLVSQKTIQGLRGDLGEGIVCRSEDCEVFSAENVHNTSGCGGCDQSREPGGERGLLSWSQRTGTGTFHQLSECRPGHSQVWGREHQPQRGSFHCQPSDQPSSPSYR